MTARSRRRASAEKASQSDWDILNDMRDLLGTTKAHFWPCLESTGQVVTGFAATDMVPSDELATVAIEDEFLPVLTGRSDGFRSYRFTGDNSRHMLAGDDAAYSFEGNGSSADSDDPFSVGCWVFPTETGSAYQTIMAKYDEGVKTEWTFGIDSSQNLALQMFDGIDGASGHITGTSVFTVDQYKMGFYVATYTGADDHLGINLYKNGVIEAAPTQAENSAYISMDDTVAPLMWGGRDDGGVPDDLLEGWMSMPFLIGKVLTADEVEALFQLGSVLVGV